MTKYTTKGHYWRCTSVVWNSKEWLSSVSHKVAPTGFNNEMKLTMFWLIDSSLVLWYKQLYPAYAMELAKAKDDGECVWFGYFSLRTYPL